LLTELHDTTRELECPIANVLAVLKRRRCPIVFVLVVHAPGLSMVDAKLAQRFARDFEGRIS
jgi:hypothetical protein